MEPPEQFKQDYINNKFKMMNVQGGQTVNGHNGHDLEDALTVNHSSPYATRLSEKESNFVARILHVGYLCSHLSYDLLLLFFHLTNS